MAMTDYYVLKMILKLIPVICFTAVVITEMFFFTSQEFIGSAVFGLLLLCVWTVGRL
jgi:hypothetical protein